MSSSPPSDEHGADDDTVPVPTTSAGPPIARPPAHGRRIDRWAAPAPDARPYRASFIGMAGMAMMLFIILASGTVLPWYAIGGLVVAWGAALVQGTRWFISSPVKVLLLPLLVLALWLGTLMLGVALFDWGQ